MCTGNIEGSWVQGELEATVVKGLLLVVGSVSNLQASFSKNGR
jgi:hypothetical protein